MSKENPYEEKLKEVLNNVEELNNLQEQQSSIITDEIKNMTPGEQKDKLASFMERVNICKANRDDKGLKEIQEELKQFI